MSLDITQRQKLAADAYLTGMSKKQAMIDAGYSEYTAKYDLSVWENPKVIRYIEERRKEMSERNQITEDWIISRLMTIADSAIGDILTVDDLGNIEFDYAKLTPEMRKAIQGISIDEFKEGRGRNSGNVRKIKIQLADRLRALEMLGKYLGMFKEKVQLTGDDDLIRRLHEGRKRARGEEDKDVVEGQEQES